MPSPFPDRTRSSLKSETHVLPYKPSNTEHCDSQQSRSPEPQQPCSTSCSTAEWQAIFFVDSKSVGRLVNPTCLVCARGTEEDECTAHLTFSCWQPAAQQQAQPISIPLSRLTSSTSLGFALFCSRNSKHSLACTALPVLEAKFLNQAVHQHQQYLDYIQQQQRRFGSSAAPQQQQAPKDTGAADRPYTYTQGNASGRVALTFHGISNASSSESTAASCPVPHLVAVQLFVSLPRQQLDEQQGMMSAHSFQGQQQAQHKQADAACSSQQGEGSCESTCTSSRQATGLHTSSSAHPPPHAHKLSSSGSWRADSGSKDDACSNSNPGQPGFSGRSRGSSPGAQGAGTRPQRRPDAYSPPAKQRGRSPPAAPSADKAPHHHPQQQPQQRRGRSRGSRSRSKSLERPSGGISADEAPTWRKPLTDDTAGRSASQEARGGGASERPSTASIQPPQQQHPQPQQQQPQQLQQPRQCSLSPRQPEPRRSRSSVDGAPGGAGSLRSSSTSSQGQQQGAGVPTSGPTIQGLHEKEVAAVIQNGKVRNGVILYGGGVPVNHAPERVAGRGEGAQQGPGPGAREDHRQAPQAPQAPPPRAKSSSPPPPTAQPRASTSEQQGTPDAHSPRAPPPQHASSSGSTAAAPHPQPQPSTSRGASSAPTSHASSPPRAHPPQRQPHPHPPAQQCPNQATPQPDSTSTTPDWGSSPFSNVAPSAAGGPVQQDRGSASGSSISFASAPSSGELAQRGSKAGASTGISTRHSASDAAPSTSTASSASGHTAHNHTTQGARGEAASANGSAPVAASSSCHAQSVHSTHSTPLTHRHSAEDSVAAAHRAASSGVSLGASYASSGNGGLEASSSGRGGGSGGWGGFSNPPPVSLPRGRGSRGSSGSLSSSSSGGGKHGGAYPRGGHGYSPRWGAGGSAAGGRFSADEVLLSQQAQLGGHVAAHKGGGHAMLDNPGLSAVSHEPAASADLERFLVQVTPMINVDLTRPLEDALRSLCLEDVWQFYHDPSLHGREVYTLGGARGPSVSYFVPYLSAMQLFTPASPKDPGTNRLYVCDTEGWPKHMHLRYEHFESELPFNRAPLYDQLDVLAQQLASRTAPQNSNTPAQQQQQQQQQHSSSSSSSHAEGPPPQAHAGSKQQGSTPAPPPAPSSAASNTSNTNNSAAAAGAGAPQVSSSSEGQQGGASQPGQLPQQPQQQQQQQQPPPPTPRVTTASQLPASLNALLRESRPPGPSLLRDVRIMELHPASWYAVAWYPVYRIPDAPLVARFLTFHSFAPIVTSIQNTLAALHEGQQRPMQLLPVGVVGLKWYNMHNERWLEALHEDGPTPGTPGHPEDPLSMYTQGMGVGAYGGASFGGGGRGRRHVQAQQMDIQFQAHLSELQATAERLARGYGLRLLGSMGSEELRLRHPDFEFFHSRS